MPQFQSESLVSFYRNSHHILIGVLIIMVGVNSFSDGLDGSVATALCALAILIAGIPHGALDIEIVSQHFKQTDAAAKLKYTATYIFLAAGMAALWFAFAELALVAFLIISIVHFGRDWRLEEEPFLGFMVGSALIALPALSHNSEVADIFNILTGSRAGYAIADGLACISIPPLLASLVFCAVAIRQNRSSIAINVAVCLAAAILLPPLAAFAVFFCGLHSPHHFRNALEEAGNLSAWQKTVVIISVTGLALGLAVFLFVYGSADTVDAGIIRTVFIALSILTLPHFLLEQFLSKMART